MKDQTARDEIRGERHGRMADLFLLGRRISKLEESTTELGRRFFYRDCPNCKRNTLQIAWQLGDYRCTLCDSLVSCHQETRCEVIEEEK